MGGLCPLHFSLLVPVFGMSSAALFLGEPGGPLRWGATAPLVGGVALTSLAPAKVQSADGSAREPVREPA